MFKIAFVEDEKNLSSLVEKYLKSEGYEVSVFNNGEDAKQHIAEDLWLWMLEIMLLVIVSGNALIKNLVIQ